MSDIYYDTYNEGEAPQEEKSKASKVAGIVWRTVVIVAVLAVFFIIFYRIFEMREPSGTGDFIFTAESLKLYDEMGTESVVKGEYGRDRYAFEKESLTSVTLTKKGQSAEEYETVTLPAGDYYEKTGFRVFEANIGSYTVRDEEANKTTTVTVTGFYDKKGSPVEGALSASHIYLIPAAKQVQLTFRYKSDSLGKLEGRKGADGSVFTYRLRDDKGKEYGSYSYKTDEWGTYRYVTMVFDGAELSNVETLTLDVHYLDKELNDAVLSIALYDSGIPLPMKAYEVKRGEIEELMRYEG